MTSQKSVHKVYEWPQKSANLGGYSKYIHFIICFSAGTKIKCFDCNSYDDYRCADPFNWTTPPPVKLCEGCCVKIVQGIDTRKYFVHKKECGLFCLLFLKMNKKWSVKEATKFWFELCKFCTDEVFASFKKFIGISGLSIPGRRRRK